MIFNPLIGITPPIPSLKPLRPPLLYDIMNSIVNFGEEKTVSITELAKQASPRIFNFHYNLSSKINQSEFEESILNHFINRRLGYETFTAWQIALKNKLFEVLPTYNKMFTALNDWDIFKDGPTETVESTDNRTVDSTTENTLSNESTTENTEDNRFSELPENMIQNVQNGSYMTDYRYVKNNATDNSTSNGNSSNNTKDDNIHSETRTKDVADKMNVYLDFIERKENIMTMLYKDLEVLFYQIID